MHLNKNVLETKSLDYQEKFNNALDELKGDINKLKTKFCEFGIFVLNPVVFLAVILNED